MSSVETLELDKSSFQTSGNVMDVYPSVTCSPVHLLFSSYECNPIYLHSEAQESVSLQITLDKTGEFASSCPS